MPEIKGFENLYLVVTFIVPGLIILFVRAQYITGRIRPHSENVLTYLALSLVYDAIALPGFEAVLEMQGPRSARVALWFALIIVGPAIFGLLLGWFVQSGLGRRIAHALGLSPVHTAPTAWDWTFSEVSKGRGQFVMVTLSDGMVAGFFGGRSFASSDPAERDLYIEEIWDVTDEGQFIERPFKAGILIPAKEVRHVQIWSDREQ